MLEVHWLQELAKTKRNYLWPNWVNATSYKAAHAIEV